MAERPILFNTEMVKAIIDGRKTQTRRLLRHIWSYSIATDIPSNKPPCKAGDILWVRETWHKDAGRYMYRANYMDDERFYRDGEEVQIHWSPSIHMPKEAARIFLCVKEVRIERLQDIKNYECVNEGAVRKPNITKRGDLVLHNRYKAEFAQVWDRTIKPAEIDKYGWNANPWVWVITFERCDKPKGWC